MTKEQIALARRAVACKGWRWMPGMLAVEQAVPGMALSTRPVRVDDYWHEVGVWLPDFDDAATLGCLLALVRAARQSPRTHVLYIEGLERWECADREQVHSCCMTEAEALVVALEEAQ